jgi:hypothetical protein
VSIGAPIWLSTWASIDKLVAAKVSKFKEEPPGSSFFEHIFAGKPSETLPMA